MPSIQTYYCSSILGMLIVWGVLTQQAKLVLADIVPDNTLPTPSNTNIQNNITTITGGTQAGNNLLHSFQEFSVDSGNTAFFDNASNIVNIINRVTGNSFSNIDGLIEANGSANLFLINPNGIVFGENARLSIGGSFFATSADSMKFSDGSTFSATNPQELPLLTVNVPMGLQYGNGGDITLQESNLQVDSGKTLGLVGGNLTIDGGQLIAETGRIELGGLTEPGTVTLNTNDNNFTLNYPVGIQRGNLSINGARVLSDGGGSISVNARNLDISEVGVLRVGFAEGLGAVGAVAGDINLNATDDITLSGGSVIASFIFPGATGDAGDINIEAGSLNLLSGSQLFSSTAGEGNSGNINVNVQDSIVFDSADSPGSTGGIISSVVGEGKGGDVTLTTGSLSITNGAQLNVFTDGNGNAGNVTINARDTVSIDEASSILNSVRENGQGKGGDITLNSGSLNLLSGSELLSITSGEGDSGNINVNVRDNIVFDSAGSGIISSVDTTGVGKTGDVNLTTGSLFLTNGAQINVNVNSENQSLGGKININARSSISLDGTFQNGDVVSGILATVNENAVGNAGDINIETGSFSATGGAGIFALTQGRGNAGNITINSGASISLDGTNPNGEASGIFTTVGENAEGDAGNINIETGSFSATGGAGLFALTQGKGNAGNVTINSDASISLDGTNSNGEAGGIFASVGENGEGNAGNINIETGSFSATGGAGLFALTQGKGNAGNVTINARESIDFDGAIENGGASGIFASVGENGEGSAGDINIETQSLSVTGGAGLFALTEGVGSPGNIDIDAREQIVLEGNDSGIYSTVEEGAVGDGKEIQIRTDNLFITNDARLSSTTEGNGAAGSITIDANSIRLNSGNINSNTVEKEGNLNLRATDLILRNGSNISTNATGENVVGGNINIDTGVLASFENSDITAFSVDSRGGNVIINTEGIFGIQFQDLLTPQSDINAAGANSGLSGNVEINTPDIDPTKSLVELPDNIIDNSDKVYIACIPGSPEFENTFVYVGTGGIPVSPLELLQESSIITNWVTLEPRSAARLRRTQATRNRKIKLPAKKVVGTNRIVEATGWMVDKDGNIEFVAQGNHISSKNSRHSPALCSVSE